MQWHQAVEAITPHVVRIATPQGTGTGFLVSRSKDRTICGVATAAHVISHAHYWEQPLRLHFAGSPHAILLRQPERAILVEESRDTAAVLFEAKDHVLPDEPFPLIEEDRRIKVGVRIGWLGYPAIAGATLCFFSGAVSAYIEDDEAYFVDGVAINGVSGGPAFNIASATPELIGVVSAYMPNRVTGEVLPGLAIVREVVQFQKLVRQIRDLEEAKEQESPPGEGPPPPPPDSDQ